MHDTVNYLKSNFFDAFLNFKVGHSSTIVIYSE
jgi:hypothetical protein